MGKIGISLEEWDIFHPGFAVYLISTQNRAGILNIAPYAMVMPISYRPLIYVLSLAKTRDTCHNIEETGEFTLNVASCELLHQINITATSFPSEVDEFSQANLTPIEGIKLSVPRVKECKGHAECKLRKIVYLEERAIILGDVVSLSIDKDVYVKDHSIQKGLLAPIFYCHNSYFSLGKYLGDKQS